MLTKRCHTCMSWAEAGLWVHCTLHMLVDCRLRMINNQGIGDLLVECRWLSGGLQTHQPIDWLHSFWLGLYGKRTWGLWCRPPRNIPDVSARHGAPVGCDKTFVDVTSFHKFERKTQKKETAGPRVLFKSVVFSSPKKKRKEKQIDRLHWPVRSSLKAKRTRYATFIVTKLIVGFLSPPTPHHPGRGRILTSVGNWDHLWSHYETVIKGTVFHNFLQETWLHQPTNRARLRV